MQKILLGFGNREAEDYLQKKLLEISNDYSFIGSAVHKEMLVSLIKTNVPDIIILREGLDGKENIFDLAKNIKYNFTNVRIIFLTTDRIVGDINLANLVSYQIYDIIIGTQINVMDIIDCIINPKKLEDVKIYLPVKEIFKQDDFKENEINTLEEKKLKDEVIKEEIIQEKKQPKSLLDNVLGLSKKISEKTIEKLDNDKSKEIEDKEDLELLNEKYREIENELNKIKEEQKKGTIKYNSEIKDNIPEKKETLKNPKIRNKQNNTYSNSSFFGKDKIITFFGPKNGIGTTTVAYNVATELALRKNKVLYIEFNDKNPMIAYWLFIFDNFSSELGIDKAILGLETNNTRDIQESIITKEKLISESEDDKESFKKFPNTLHYLFFSAQYIETKNKPIISYNSLSQLLLYLMQQLGYNYIILDINSQIDISLIETALTYSNKNYIVISQEFSSIGYSQIFFKKLEKKGIVLDQDFLGEKNLIKKNAYILNRYNNKCDLNTKVARDWLEQSKIFTLCSNDQEISDCSFNLKPIMSFSNNNLFKNDITQIATDIEHV